METIRNAFAHVDVEAIVIEYDPLIAAEVAKVIVRDDQLSEALRENGLHAKTAAIQSGLHVEVVLERRERKELIEHVEPASRKEKATTPDPLGAVDGNIRAPLTRDSMYE
jgi:transcription antitermination factor NusA-like protein